MPNPCVNCGHLRKDHRYLTGDWTCQTCWDRWSNGERPDYCTVYVPTRLARAKC